VADFEERLKARLYRVTCPSSVELGEYHLNLVPANRKLVIAQHLRTCPHCARELVQLQDFLAGEAPMGLVQQAKVIIARLAGSTMGLSPAAIPVRGASGKGLITLEADGIMVVLDVQPANGGRLKINGQLGAQEQDQWTGAKVELLQAGAQEFETTISDLGTFEFESITAGSKELRITPADESLIVTCALDISP
jgi:hypothetical protein